MCDESGEIARVLQYELYSAATSYAWSSVELLTCEIEHTYSIMLRIVEFAGCRADYRHRLDSDDSLKGKVRRVAGYPTLRCERPATNEQAHADTVMLWTLTDPWDITYSARGNQPTSSTLHTTHRNYDMAPTRLTLGK